MSEPGEQGGSGEKDGNGKQQPVLGRELVFGDPLDRQTSDDTDQGWGERPRGGESGGHGLDWYLSQRPPHHGD
ncbi:hypothetical protein AB0K43_15045 [Kitasatospora sp. NPDC049258]|uniref:hypothetical protein n=1 Tax=Kitasatospora sp. NPDC049258 TaxID=3155394 RepID=UPI00343D3414